MSIFGTIVLGIALLAHRSLQKHLELIKTLKKGDKIKIALGQGTAEGHIKEVKDKSFVIEIEVPHISVNSLERN